MSLMRNFAAALKDLADGVKLAPLWWRIGLEATITRYRRTILGPFWLASSTLSSAFSIAVVFGSIFGTDTRSSLPYIITGIVAWAVTGAMLADAAGTFFTGAGVMQVQKLPLSFHVFLQVDKLYINFAHQLVALWAVLLIMRLLPVPHWEILFGLPIAAATAVMLYFPIGMIAMRYRDINYLIGFISNALFMLTPVFWRREQISAKLQWIVTYNPFAHLVEIVRQPLLGHPAALQDWAGSLVFLAMCTVATLVSLTLYRRRVVFWV